MEGRMGAGGGDEWGHGIGKKKKKTCLLFSTKCLGSFLVVSENSKPSCG